MDFEYTQAEFVVDGLTEKFVGWTNGQTWNGFSCPLFEEDEADKIIAALTVSESGTTFSKSADCINMVEAEYLDEPVAFSSKRIETQSGVKTVFGLGAFMWTWQRSASLKLEGN